MPEARRRYAQVGLGGRSKMYTDAIIGDFSHCAELVGFCDVNQSRMDLRNREIAERVAAPVPTYRADKFDCMIEDTNPDVVIVTSVDATHSDYICRAMELGRDVVTEKPMTTDDQRCRKILNTIAATGRNLQVTFNYRYSPHRVQVKEILAEAAIGEILSVDFTWLLDTRHGADYFRRWHRRRENSGSLLVHKATHHFDLINWWLEDAPEEVFAHGRRAFYTPAMAEQLGLQGRAERCKDCGIKENCRFYFDLNSSEDLKNLYLDCEHDDGYFRDRCVFSDRIDIWDNMAVNVRYRRSTLLSYMLHSYSPYEGYRIALNGTKGRLEHACCENSYVSGKDPVPGELKPGNTNITLIPAFSSPQEIEVRTGTGGHGGGDPVLLADVFDPNAPADPLHRRAGHRDGAHSILIGVAACHSIDSGRAIRIDDLLDGAPLD